MARYMTFKRWALNEGRQESELLCLIGERILPL